ncbi:MAG: peptide-methionine (S)-S-oxide reductase MsrA [Terrisporobacter sp.]|uniref:peptide-methionine (S)-S-oxide reductase MsrA n=1 Tax=Terrisporobacter sp. TaxID=1965305 RepID=UPI002FCB5BA1
MEKTATFAGGCFWCMVEDFKKLKGVKKVEVGYSGGHVENPTFEMVNKGEAGHYLAVQIIYDDEVITYNKLLDTFWNLIDPTDEGGQFGDQGNSFKSAVFYHDKEQESIASNSIEMLEESNAFGYFIFTKILPAKTFYRAEEFHQNFYKKNPLLYKEYFRFSGREEYLQKSYARRHLTNIQYEVTQNKIREKPFKNEYYNNYEEGIYVDIVDGTPLFSSKEKIKGNFGWPTFIKPLDNDLIILIKDDCIVNKIEVRSKNSNIHLGYILNDTLEDFRNRILSINSSSLKFIHKNKFGGFEDLIIKNLVLMKQKY